MILAWGWNVLQKSSFAPCWLKTSRSPLFIVFKQKLTKLYEIQTGNDLFVDDGHILVFQHFFSEKTFGIYTSFVLYTSVHIPGSFVKKYNKRSKNIRYTLHFFVSLVRGSQICTRVRSLKFLFVLIWEDLEVVWNVKFYCQAGGQEGREVYQLGEVQSLERGPCLSVSFFISEDFISNRHNSFSCDLVCRPVSGWNLITALLSQVQTEYSLLPWPEARVSLS